MVDIHSSRAAMLHDEWQKPYFLALKKKLLEEKKHYIVYPPSSHIFAAFDITPFDDVRVVILGQDPYHGAGQAMGLSFSVPKHITIPPSLKNIYKEILSHAGEKYDEILARISVSQGDLTRWAQQGVFLLNAFLTVRAGQPASHQALGRETFTDAVIHQISTKKTHVVFLLRGTFAKSKMALIDQTKHLVLHASHPSPFSAHQGFFGCNHFVKTNEYLEKHGYTAIDR